MLTNSAKIITRFNTRGFMSQRIKNEMNRLKDDANDMLDDFATTMGPAFEHFVRISSFAGCGLAAHSTWTQMKYPVGWRDYRDLVMSIGYGGICGFLFAFAFPVTAVPFAIYYSIKSDQNK